MCAQGSSIECTARESVSQAQEQLRTYEAELRELDPVLQSHLVQKERLRTRESELHQRMVRLRECIGARLPRLGLLSQKNKSFVRRTLV